MSAAGAGAALQSVGQGLMNLGIRSAEHDYQRERMAAEEEMRLRAEQRAESRTIGAEKRQVDTRIAEENRVIERRKGIIQGVDEEFGRITANREADAAGGGLDTAPAPNRAAMIRDRAAISDPDLARIYGETETREYQRGRDVKADEKSDRQFELQEKQLKISEQSARNQLGKDKVASAASQRIDAMRQELDKAILAGDKDAQAKLRERIAGQLGQMPDDIKRAHEQRMAFADTARALETQAKDEYDPDKKTALLQEARSYRQYSIGAVGSPAAADKPAAGPSKAAAPDGKRPPLSSFYSAGGND